MNPVDYNDELANQAGPLVAGQRRIAMTVGWIAILAGAAFSAMVANATAGGTMLSDALGRGPSPSTRIARCTSATILLWGLVITILFTKSPVQLIIFAQALTVLVAPFLGYLLLTMSNNRNLMGDLKNTWWKNILGVVGFLAILSLLVARYVVIYLI